MFLRVLCRNLTNWSLNLFIHETSATDFIKYKHILCSSYFFEKYQKYKLFFFCVSINNLRFSNLFTCKCKFIGNVCKKYHIFYIQEWLIILLFSAYDDLLLECKKYGSLSFATSVVRQSSLYFQNSFIF